MQTQSGKYSLYPLKGSDSISILVFRCAAVLVAVALAFSPIAPIGGYAQTFDERDCPRNGGVWNGTSCDFPTPEEQCALDGGTWNTETNLCDMPAPSPEPSPPPPSDVCPNVPGDQASGPCADEQCFADGGIWDGDSCDVAGDEIASGGNEDGSSE